MPSPAYFDAIAEGARHHASSKTYSGSLLRPHKSFLSEMVERLDCTSGLDWGAGKGTQYAWVDPSDGLTLERAWGFKVRKYDPCWVPYAAEPVGKFDLVICTHTLALIPVQDLDWVLGHLYAHAAKAVFIAEKIGGRKKHEVADPNNRAICWSPEQWMATISPAAAAHPEIETALSIRVREPRGTITTRHIWREGAFVGSFEAIPRG